jgi:hypothetical protein
VRVSDEAGLAREQCRVWSWLEARKDAGEVSAVEFARAVDELREPDQLSAFVISQDIPDGFGPVAPLLDEQRNAELDTIETRLRRMFLERYGGRHVVMNRFVVLHVTQELAHTLDGTRRRATFGTRIWAEPARFTLVELEYAWLRLKRDALPEVTSLHFDVEHNSVLARVVGDPDDAQKRLRAMYGEMVSAEGAAR